MRGLNLIALFNKKGDRVLMCTRKKDPYKGLINFPGGKIELGEDGLTAAYRELEEETAVTFEDVTLTLLLTFVYPLDNCYVEVYLYPTLLEHFKRVSSAHFCTICRLL